MIGAGRASVRAVLGLAGLLVLLTAVLAVLHRPELRGRLDATRTRAYALAPSTRELLAGLDGDWTVTVVLAGDTGDAVLRRQVEEVLRRFDQASDALAVRTLDPADPDAFPVIDRLLVEVEDDERALVDRWARALEDGRAALEALILFAGRRSAGLETMLSSLPPVEQLTADQQGLVRRLQTRTGLLAVLAADGGLLLDEVDKARRTGGVRLRPDDETARSILVAALDRWGDELVALAADLETLADATGTPPLREIAGEFREQATALARASVALGTLRVPEVQALARALAEGELAVVRNERGTITIPGAQLLPRLAGGLDEADAEVRIDRRFRGEQVLSAAIRSLVFGTPPTVVFVHAEERSLLAPAAGGSGADLAGAAAVLRANRRPVREWRVTEGPRPAVTGGAGVAWVVVPPLSRPRLEPTAAEQRLLAAARELVADGEPVLLSVNPSPLPRYGTTDPWARLLEGVGVRAGTDVVLFEAVPIGGAGFVRQASFSTETPATTDHPLAAALAGQRTTMVIPVPVEPAADVAGDATVLLAAPASGNRWLDPDWIGRLEAARTTERGDPVAGAVPLALAIERTHPTQGAAARQRLLVLGSGGWMLSRVLDAAADLGDGRAALVNPGNQDLLLGATAWLAGGDDLVVATAAGAQVSRLSGLDGSARVRWSLFAVLGVPALCIVLGIVPAVLRRSR